MSEETQQSTQQQQANQQGSSQAQQQKGKSFFSSAKYTLKGFTDNISGYFSEPAQDQGKHHKNQEEHNRAGTARKTKGQGQEQAPSNKAALVVDDEQTKQQRRQYEQKQGRGTGAKINASEGKTDYYELLNVPKDANESQIRKQYYLLARQYHPDKNPDDPQAKERFQKLGEAYQVLSNPDARSKYDKYGAEGVDNMEVMDQAEFFNMLFGSDKFEPLIGELLLTSAAKAGGELAEEQVKKIQEERQQKLVTQLHQFLESYVDGGEQDFKTMITTKAQDWVQSNFGSTILKLVGRVYSRQAEIYSGKFLPAQLAKFKQQKDILKNQWQAIKKVVRVMTYENQMERDLALLEQQYHITKEQRETLEEQELTEEDLAKVVDEQKKKHQEGAKAPQKGQNDATKHHNRHDKTQQQEESQEQHLTPEQKQQQQIEFLMRKAQLEEARIPIMLEAMWAANSIDIENTVRTVCTQLFQKEENKVKRVRLASGLKLFGDILRSVAQTHEDHIGKQEYNVKEQFEKAMQEAMEKKMQHEDEKYATEQPSTS